MAFLVEKQYEDGRHVDQPLECELQGEDLDGKKYKMVRVKGLTSSWAEKSNVTSGVTTIFAPEGATIDDYASELIVPSETAIKVRRYDDGCCLTHLNPVLTHQSPPTTVWHSQEKWFSKEPDKYDELL